MAEKYDGMRGRLQAGKDGTPNEQGMKNRLPEFCAANPFL